MKTEGAIQQKLKQVRFRHLQRELEARLSEEPGNCKHLTEQGACKVHNAPCGQKAHRPPTCGVFENANEKEELKTSMKEFFSTRPAAEIAARFPDVAALMWVLDGDLPTDVFTEETLEADLRNRIGLLKEAMGRNLAIMAEKEAENTRLKAALYDKESAAFSDRVLQLERERRALADLDEGRVEELVKLRNEVASITLPTDPWYTSLLKKLWNPR